MIIIKKGTAIVLSILLVIVLAIGVFVFIEWDNLVAVVDGFMYSPEAIEKIKIENQKEIDNAMKKYPDLHFRDLTTEEVKALAEGSITREDVSLLVTDKAMLVEGKIIRKDGDDKNSSQNENENANEKENTSKKTETNINNEVASKQENKKDTQENEKSSENVNRENNNNGDVQPHTDEELAKALEDFYVLKASILARIDSSVNGIIAEYKAHPDSERGPGLRAEYAKKAISLAGQMESQFDGEFSQVVSNLEGILEKNGGDTSIVDTVKSAYKKEKVAAKASYISKAKKYLN